MAKAVFHAAINHDLGFRCLNSLMLNAPLPSYAYALPLQQSPAYARTIRALGQDAQLIHADGVGQVTVISRQTALGRLRAALRGPLWDTDDPERQAQFLRQTGAHVLGPEITAARVMRAAGYWQVMTAAHVGMLDLTQDLAPAMHPKWRHSWRRAQRADIKITAQPFDQARDMWLMSLERAQQRVIGYRGYPRPFTFAFARENPDAAMTYVAYQGRAKIAAMIFLLHHPTATYHIGWSGEEGRRACAHHLLLTQAAQDFAALGITALDLGQIDTRRTPGLARFKLGSGARAVELGGTWMRLPWSRRRGLQR